MTETCSGISGFWINKFPDKLDSVGIPFKNVKISIINNFIAVESPTIMRGYLLGDEQKIPMLTSDVGLFDGGFLYITKRVKDMAISGGENINIKYIKDTLLTHKSIKSVSINIIKNNEWGESIEADIRLNSNTNTINEDKLRNWCKSKLSKFSIPKRISFT